MKKRYKIAILALTAAVATTSVVSVVSCGKKNVPLNTDFAGKTVCYELPTDGSTPDQHTGIENIGYMVYRLQNQPSYYSEMHGKVSTMIEQTVETYKQYNDGVMIAADISVSSMVKTAQQTCFVGDYVLWRGPATGAAEWNGLDTEWVTKDPTKITLEDYKANYGLPGTDFSVYILNADTVLSASDVTVNGDGTYSQTFELNPETDAAPYYYRQKMLTTGGLDEWPTFSSITVTYTFDSTWQILSSVIDESYSAKMIVSVGCTAHYVTTYEYDTDKAVSDDYEQYYSNYADKPVSELPSGGEITSVGCLTQAFGDVLTGPATFNVTLDINGNPLEGAVYVDINKMDIRAAFGDLRLWYAGNEVCLALGDLKAKVSVEEFAALLGGMLPEGSSDFSEAIDVNAILEQLGNGAFVVGDTQATLDTTLSLFGMDLPVCFSFNLGDTITLGSVKADLAFGDFSLGIAVTSGTQVPEGLPASDKDSYIPLMPYVNALVDLFTNDVLSADISYANGGLSLDGQISVNVKDFAAAGEFSVGYGKISKRLSFSFDGESVYLNLDGVKLRANAEEAVALIGKYVDLPELKGAIDIGSIVGAVLSLDVDSLVQMSESDNTLQIAVKGTELLKAFGVEFELGDVALNVTESGLTASALGAEIAVTAGEPFTADTEGYADIVRYAGYLIDLFSNENLKAAVFYANGDIAVNGTVALNLKDLLVKGEFVVTYKNVQKDVKVIYGGNVIYLELDGLKVKASVEEALALVKEFVAIPETDTNAEDILLKVLSLNFGEVIAISEDGTLLSVVLKGTELLKALGVEFELGDVALNVTESGLTASALGAEIAVTAGEPFTADTEGYADIVRYAGYLIDLFSNENLKAAVFYANGDIAVNGTVALNLKDLLVKGEFVVTYKNVQKDVKVIYGGNVIYLELDGLKVKASVEEALALVKEFVAIPETDTNAEDILLKVLSLNFGEVIAISEDGTLLSVVLKGTELLKALGVEFELGDVALNVTESGLTASALGAEIAVTAGEPFTADTEGYADIVKYAGYLIDLFSNENLKASVSYANGDIAVKGTVALNLNSLLVKGEFVVTYKNVQKDVKVIYGGNVIYLELDGLKVKASVEEALALVKEFVAIPETDTNAEDILLKVLSLNFGEVIAISEDGTLLSVVLKGTELLKALGVEFELGDVALNVTESGLTASALGAKIAVTAGEPFTADTEGYVDAIGTIRAILSIIKQEAVTIGGAVDLTIGTTQVNLILNKAAISWKDGFKLYAEMTVYVAGTQHDIMLQADGTSVQLAYGAIGATVAKEELPTLEEAIVSLYNRIKSVVDEVVTAAESPLPAISGWEDLLALLGFGGQVSELMNSAQMPAGDTIAELLKNIEFCAPTQPNGIFVLKMGALTAELLQNPADRKLIFQIDYAGEGFAVSAEVHAEALAGAFPAIPESVHLLTADDFAVLCDYVGAAAESVLLNEVTVSLDGTVWNAAEEYAPFGGVKYAIDAQIEYRSGGKFPVSLDLDGKKITVSPDVYAHISLDMTASLASDQSLYLEFYLLDANPDGTTDGKLDLYLSVSRFAEGAAEYAPLNLYLPADDLMTAVSAVLSMAGLESDFLNEAIISEWLDVETAEQLRALGDSLKGTLGLDELLGALGVSAMSETDAFVVSDLIREFTVTDERLSLVLESDTVYGASMPDDITLSLSKGTYTAGESSAPRGYLSAFGLENVYTDETAAEKISLALSLAPSCAASGVSIGSYYNFMGAGQLLKTIAASATHPAESGYAVNDYFFLSGTVNLNALSLLKVTVNIEGISVYLDEDFNVAVDMRISYPGVQELNQVLINGDSAVDVSIRGGMVYMKRVQTSEWYWNTLISMKEREIAPVTLYRVMPLERFMDDILNQLIFLFNFGDVIADQIAGGGDPAPAETTPVDYGSQVASYLTSYSYAAGTSPAWTVVLNGASLTDDVMEDINITLKTDADGILSGLTATTSVYSLLNISADLVYRNPCGQMQEGITDPTVNIGEYLDREMSKGLAETDWENTLYLEAAPKSANFIAVGELLKTQTVLCDTTSNAIYTQLSYPDLSSYPELTGYRLGWKETDILPADGNLYANYVANVYTVTVLSEREAEGMTYDEALGMWKAELSYTYGTKLELPAGLFSDKSMQTVSYTDAEGTEYSFVENILSDLTLTAHWDYIEYTVQFVADGETVGTQTAHYGDAIDYPEIPEKAGYDIVGWNTSALTAEGDMVIEAVYAAKTFTVTLFSEFELEGFTACEGGYTLALDYIYGETLALPVGVEKEHHFLNVFEDSDGNTYTVIENILSDLTLTARWEELGYKVDFVADGVTIATHNYYEGDTLNPPAVPEKAGYVGSWDIPEGYTVSCDDTVYAVYTPATYTVTVYSAYAADGFAETADGLYSYSFDYTYGDAAIVLDTSLKIPCYDFGGYTLSDGTPVSQVENIVSDLAVYVVWVDNTVTVRLSSDVQFDGYEGYNAADGYYLTAKFNDVYDLTQALTAAGYKQFGWWTEANGSWERVTSVAELDGAAVWAAWIADDLNVTVTEASTSLGSWGGTWTIGGTYQGGEVYGDHSREIFSAVGVSRSDGVYYRASKDGANIGDTLSSGDLVGVSGGTFHKSGMPSAKGSLWKYGGADAHITYSYGDLSVTLDSATVFRKK